MTTSDHTITNSITFLYYYVSGFLLVFVCAAALLLLVAGWCGCVVCVALGAAGCWRVGLLDPGIACFGLYSVKFSVVGTGTVL